MNKLARLFSSHPKLIIVGIIITTLCFSWFSKNFKIDASAETLLLKNNRLYIETQVMNKRFSPQEFILVAYEPKNHGVFSEKTFSDISALMASFKKIERVEDVTSILNVPLITSMASLQADVSANNWTWQSQQYSPEKMQQLFTKHPLFTDLLVNQSQTATAIQIVFKADPKITKIQSEITDLKQKVLSDEFSDADQVKIDQLKLQAEPLIEALDKKRVKEIEAIYRITDQYKQQADTYLGGAHILGFQLIKIIKNDLQLFGSSIALMIALMLWLLFRQWQWVFIPITCCIVSVLMTVGLFGMLDMRTTVISSNFIALQLILTLALVIHLIVEYRQIAESNQNMPAKTVAEKTFLAKAKPCFYAGITTSIGFGSLIFSNIQPVVSFGWMMVVAITISTIVSLTLFPTILALLKPKHKALNNKISSGLLSFLTRLSINKRTLIFSLSGLLLITSLLGVFKLTVENSFINYFKKSTLIHQELVYIDQEFGGSTPFDLVYTIPKKQRQKDLSLTAEAIQAVQKIQYILKQNEAVGNVTSMVNFATLAKQINKGAPLTEYELDLIYQIIDQSLRDKLLGAYFSEEHHQLRISSRIQDATKGLNRADFLKKLNQELDALGIEQGSISKTNLFVLYQDILQKLFKSQIMTLGIVYIVLSFVFLLIFRSIKIAIIAIVPNIISTVFVLGVMGWLNISLDLMTITIASIAMGIAVDSTIHQTHRYIDTLAKDEPNVAIEKTLNSVGYAMLYTTLIVLIGFALLGFSDFVPSILFGLLTSLGMLIALLCDLALLPALLSRFIVDEKTS